MSASGGTRAIIAAFLANLGVACAKLVGFFVTSSASLLAESVHSFADTGNQALLLLGARRAKREASPLHPFGYGRERYFWAFVVALVLFTGGSLFAVYEGIDKIRHPHELESLGWAIGILGLAIVLEGYSLRTAIVESNTVRGTTSWSTFIRRSRSPELPVVLLEDLGAMVGLVIALSAILTAEVTGDAVWDGIGTVSIGVLLGVIAIVLAIEMKSLLIGEGAVADQRERIVAAIAGAPEVVQLIHLRTLHLGPEELLVTAKVEYTRGLDVPALARTIDQTESAIRAATDLSAVVYIEPDIRRTHGASAAGSGEAHP